MRRLLLPVVAAAVAAVAVAGMAGAAGADRTAARTILALDPSGAGGGALVRLDPRTLKRLPGRLPLAEPVGYAVRSPDRRRLAFADRTGLHLVDARTLTDATIQDEGLLDVIAWPAGRPIVVRDAGGIARVAPSAAVVLDRVDLPKGLPTLVAPAIGMEAQRGFPVTLRVLDERGAPAVRLGRLWAGERPWRPEDEKPRPVDAADAVAGAVADAAARSGQPAQAVRVISVASVDWPDSSLGCPVPDGRGYVPVVTPGFEIVVGAGGSLLDYRAATGSDPTVVLCPMPASAIAPALGPQGPPGGAVFLGDGVTPTVAVSGRRAVLLAPGRLAAVVDLTRRRVRYRRLSAALEQPRLARFVTARAVAVAGSTAGGRPARMRLVDTATWRVRSLAARPASIVATGGVAVAAGGEPLPGWGLVGYDAAGRERWRSLAHARTGYGVVAAVGYVYAETLDEPGVTRAVEARTGQVTGRLGPGPPSLRLLG